MESRNFKPLKKIACFGIAALICMQLHPVKAFSRQPLGGRLAQGQEAGECEDWQVNHSKYGTSATNALCWTKTVSVTASETIVKVDSFQGCPTVQVKTSNGIDKSFHEPGEVSVPSSGVYGEEITIQVYYTAYGSGCTQVKGRIIY